MKSTDDAQPPVDERFATESRTDVDAPAMTTYAIRSEAQTSSVPDFVDVTDDVHRAVADSEIRHGRAIVFAPGDVCSIMVNERESGLLQDLKRALQRLRATNSDESHAVFGSSSVVLPVEQGRLRLGMWQRVLLVELTEASPRHVDIEVIGER